MKKECSKCGVPKDRSCFYLHRKGKDGIREKCKVCERLHRKEYRDNPENKEKIRKQRKEYGQKPRARIGKVKSNARFRAKYPLKFKAQCEIQKAIQSGKITSMPCAVCGSTDNVHAHHGDYSRPFDVVWLCVRHHTDVHLELRQQQVNLNGG